MCGLALQVVLYLHIFFFHEFNLTQLNFKQIWFNLWNSFTQCGQQHSDWQCITPACNMTNSFFFMQFVCDNQASIYCINWELLVYCFFLHSLSTLFTLKLHQQCAWKTVGKASKLSCVVVRHGFCCHNWILVFQSLLQYFYEINLPLKCYI